MKDQKPLPRHVQDAKAGLSAGTWDQYVHDIQEAIDDSAAFDARANKRATDICDQYEQRTSLSQYHRNQLIERLKSQLKADAVLGTVEQSFDFGDLPSIRT